MTALFESGATQYLKVADKLNGKFAAIPAKIINEMPFPIPRLVIWSAIHNDNIVPANNTIGIKK